MSYHVTSVTRQRVTSVTRQRVTAAVVNQCLAACIPAVRDCFTEQ